MKNYPIWLDIKSCIYKASKSFGIQKHGVQNVKVGTSATYSWDFATIELTHEEQADGSRVYTLLIDGKTVKKGVMTLDGKDRDFHISIDELENLEWLRGAIQNNPNISREIAWLSAIRIAKK